MTFAAVKKLALQLPPKQRMKLAKVLFASIRPIREPLTIAELEARADEVESGKVKAIPWDVFEAELAKMIRSRS